MRGVYPDSEAIPEGSLREGGVGSGFTGGATAGERVRLWGVCVFDNGDAHQKSHGEVGVSRHGGRWSHDKQGVSQ